ncbi:MAG TPA: four-carbon acid sugar kinase family protein, partial [Pyrinomonadaceae bacterium]|nr:four-carbon acid sugar kinase family protein [Pyrinomonadaceae bacterium]
MRLPSINVHRQLLLSYYGDDFTGSTDALEALSVAGVGSALFFEPPTLEELSERHGDLRAVGVVGVSRSWTPEGMDAELPGVFERIKQLGAGLFHYKV